MPLVRFASLALIVLALALIPNVAHASNVLDLTGETFDDALKANPNGILVEFFAPWCGHCQKLAPEYEKAADMLKGTGTLAKVDCTQNNELCVKHNVAGFPTLLWFQTSLPSATNIERTAKSIVEFVNSKLNELKDEGNSKVHILTVATFNNTLKDTDAVVEFYAPWCGHCRELAPKFEEAAATASEVYFGKVNCDLNGDLCAQYNVEGYPSIQFIRNLKGTPYTGDRSVSSIVDFARNKVEEPKTSNVIDLGANDFDSAISLNSKILVEFYAPWCGHCKALAPEYEKAATELKGKVPLAKVDCTAHNELCTKHNIGGYPTIKYFEDGIPSDYSGERVAASIIAFMRKKTLGPVTSVETEEQLDEVEEITPAIIGYFSSKTDGMYETFLQVARNPSLGDLTFATVTGDLAKKLAKTIPSIRFVRGPEVGEDLWWTDSHFKNFEPWIRANEFALVGEIGPSTFKKYVDSGKDLFVVFLDPTKKAETLAQAGEVAAETKKYHFGWSDGVQWASVAERWLGHAPTSLPVVVYLNFADDIQHGLESFSVSKLREFVKGIEDGTIKWTPKSEPEPTEQKDAVFTAVGTTLEQVIKQKKDVLVEFYAPWCGHCQQLAPEYEKLASALKDVSSIVIAKIDATANDVKHIVGKQTVQGFPTILFFPANVKDMPGITFSGERTISGFVDFLHKHAATAFKNPPALEALLREPVEEEDEHAGHAHGTHEEL